MQRAAAIFESAFGHAHSPAFVEVWTFILQLDPCSFLAARENGEIVGYAIFVSSLKRVQREAIRTGAIFRWAIAALRGGFALTPAKLWRILVNKALFVRGGGRFRTQGDAQLLNIAVDPQAQGRGIAAALVREGLLAMHAQGVREVRLEVRPWNAPAVRLYEKTGWREVGRTRDTEGEWLVMVAKP